MKSKSQIAKSVSVAALLAGGALCSPALAQETGAGEDQQARMDRVVVTAQKREQDLQDVPISISAFSESALEEGNIVNVQDIAKLVPSLNIPSESPSGASNGIIFMRGIGTDNTQFTLDPAVGIYNDGVYMARAYGTLFDFFDIERIEVLRGPQGTLYGRNNSVGAIRIISKAPSLSEFDLAGRVGIGSFDEVSGAFTASAPIVEDKLGVRVSYSTRQNDGVQTNLQNPGDRAQSTDLTGLKAALLWTPTEAIDVSLRYQRVADRGDATQNVPLGDANPETFESDLQNLNEVTTDFVTGKLDWDLNDSVTLTAQSSFATIDLNTAFNLDGVGTAEFSVPVQFIDSEYTNQEIYLSGSGLGGADIDWVVGAFYFDEEVTEQSIARFGANIIFPGQAPFDAPADRLLETTSVAFYGQGTWNLTDRFSVTAGGRWSDDEKDFSETFSATDASFSDDQLTWRLAVDFQAADNILLYGSASTGYRAGGFDINSGSPFPTEEVLTYEAGAKTEFFDNRLRINAAYFFNDFEDLQQSVLSGSNPFGLGTISIDAESSDLELEVLAEPADGLNLGLVLSTLDSDVDGAPLVLKQSPELSYRIFGQYEFDLGEAGSLTAGASYNYSDEFFIDTLNDPNRVVNEYGTVDARIAWAPKGDNWELALSGQNLTDEDEPTFIFRLPFGGLSEPLTKFPRKPTTWMLTATYRY